MIILTIKSDEPQAALGIYDNNELLKKEEWLADRSLADSIHLKIEALLKTSGKDWTDIGGIVCFEGPGSFTGLRIGLSVGNALAYGLGAPIIGARDKDWEQTGIKKLLIGKNDDLVLPHYGSEPHITPPKK
jgi:tRNA threonylcarbamoyladenosine biosynthesis protein TsaB